MKFFAPSVFSSSLPSPSPPLLSTVSRSQYFSALALTSTTLVVPSSSLVTFTDASDFTKNFFASSSSVSSLSSSFLHKSSNATILLASGLMVSPPVFLFSSSSSSSRRRINFPLISAFSAHEPENDTFEEVFCVSRASFSTSFFPFLFLSRGSVLLSSSSISKTVSKIGVKNGKHCVVDVVIVFRDYTCCFKSQTPPPPLRRREASFGVVFVIVSSSPFSLRFSFGK